MGAPLLEDPVGQQGDDDAHGGHFGRKSSQQLDCTEVVLTVLKTYQPGELTERT